MNGTEEHKEMGSSGVQMFSPSLTRSQMFEGVARVDAPAAVLKPDASSIELSLKRPNVQNSIKDKVRPKRMVYKTEKKESLCCY